MDINFHYFAIKTIAVEAGFDETEAQQIATYSQYVDDFDWIKPVYSDNIPEYLKDKNCDLYLRPRILGRGFNFRPTPTGFAGLENRAVLLQRKMQKFMVSPFHFAPRAAGKISRESRTAPTEIGDGTFLSDMLIDARGKIIKREDEDRSVSLMRIGILLHTFADTHAHQLFSGYDSWVNDVKLIKVTNNINGNDLTDKELEKVKKQRASIGRSRMYILPYIGHMWIFDTPDQSNLSFEMRYKKSKKDNYGGIYARSNTETFADASLHILNYLRSCLGRDPVSAGDWAIFAEKLKFCFLVNFPSKNIVNELTNHWKKHFQYIQYDYNKDKISGAFYESGAADTGVDTRLKSRNYTGAFYAYNHIANTLLIKMYGPNSRKRNR
ncbi:MAG: hypothetical protein LBU70_10270 [Chitinispirillales bacterium]|jgi:hypothetical protein|nr:hypothetical protein [Chitinispirillales bacterium]